MSLVQVHIWKFGILPLLRCYGSRRFAIERRIAVLFIIEIYIATLEIATRDGTAELPYRNYCSMGYGKFSVILWCKHPQRDQYRPFLAVSCKWSLRLNKFSSFVGCFILLAIRRKENGWCDDEHPLVFLFLGSSGIGT